MRSLAALPLATAIAFTHGQQGTAPDDALAAYINVQIVVKSDVVIWYCAHLGHHAEQEHANEYLACGPTLSLFR
jgi:hypothetical protein